ncbi:hypothetical protein D9757_014285 [Collybiopsis confluens]|uniref:Uncharacterized protein n=1 Tax=Collybiopsis confluens TaxID=2823264 RepID=A0A8H5CRE9_9AGAR|nr:hypothetical protein D9757_014285 [Collybiopsis confluens]
MEEKPSTDEIARAAACHSLNIVTPVSFSSFSSRSASNSKQRSSRSTIVFFEMSGCRGLCIRDISSNKTNLSSAERSEMARSFGIAAPSSGLDAAGAILGQVERNI